MSMPLCCDLGTGMAFFSTYNTDSTCSLSAAHLLPVFHALPSACSVLKLRKCHLAKKRWPERFQQL